MTRIQALAFSVFAITTAVPAFAAQDTPAEPAVPGKAAAVAPGVFTQDLDAAKALAAERDIPVMLDFTGSDWCGWCKFMDERVFSKEEWNDWAATNLFLVKIDFPEDSSLVPEKWRQRNQELAKQYGIEGLPTFVLLNPAGTEVGRLGTSPDASPGKFIDDIRLTLAESDRALVEKVLGAEDAALLAALDDKVKAAKAAAAEAQKQVEEKTEQWRAKLADAKGQPSDKAAAIRRAATRDIAAAMSAAQKAENDAEKAAADAAETGARLRAKLLESL